MMTEVEYKQVKHGLRGKGHKLVGVFLTALGVFWFAHKVGWIPAFNGGSAIFWPLLTIGMGLFILFGSKHRHIRKSE